MPAVACFGISSMHFGIEAEGPISITVEQYRREVLQALQALPNISEIEIFVGDTTPTDAFREASPDKMDQRQGLFPDLTGSGFAIRFLIHIPFRLQAELAGHSEDELNTNSENFSVDIRYAFLHPVAYVVPIDATEHSYGSEAAIAARAFLEREFDQRDTGRIRFESWEHPFHADCFVFPADEDDEAEAKLEADFAFRQIPRGGFPDVIFRYNPRKFKGADEALPAILKEVEDQLSYFYWAWQSRESEYRSWRHVTHHVSELTRIQAIRGPRGMWMRTFGYTRRLDEAFITLAQFETQRLEISNLSSGYRHDILSPPTKPCFEPQIDELVAHPFVAANDQVGRIVNLFEARMNHRVEVLGFVLASLVGGVVGAIITLGAR